MNLHEPIKVEWKSSRNPSVVYEPQELLDNVSKIRTKILSRRSGKDHSNLMAIIFWESYRNRQSLQEFASSDGLKWYLRGEFPRDLAAEYCLVQGERKTPYHLLHHERKTAIS